MPDAAHILQAGAVPALPDPCAAVSAGLENPIGSPPLRDLLKSNRPRTAVVTISDITRPVPNKEILPPVLKVLRECGLGPDAVTLIIATGMHRESTDEEKIELVGREILSQYRVRDHRSEVRSELAALPRKTRHGTQAYVNRAYLESDFKIVTGFIEPHFMAGFSGGRKGVCPGLTNVETVQKFHGYEFLESDNAANLVLDGNPLHEEATDVASMAGINFLVNVSLNETKQMAGVYAGDWQQAFLAGAADVAKWSSAECPGECDVVISCAGGYPLDKTLYQTGKGMCSVLPILKQGGIAAIASACSEGLGSPSFSAIMREWGSDWRGFLKQISECPEVLHDQWGFQMHTKVLRKTNGPERLLFACGGIPHVDLQNMSLNPLLPETFENETEAVRIALQSVIDNSRNKILAIIPDGPYTVCSTTS